jgi:hypothetical protein
VQTDIPPARDLLVTLTALVLYALEQCRVRRVRKVFVATVMAGFAAALATCNRPPSRVPDSAMPLAYEPTAPVTRTPLAPLAGYASAPNSSLSTTNAPSTEQLGWHASPRWTAIKDNGILLEPDDAQAKFKAAQRKASKVGVENLSEADLEGLTPAQLRALRGY